jgi:N-acyl-D-amino-acid deacylase
MATVLFKSGTIVDGSGKPGFAGHLLIRNDKIEAVLKVDDPLPEADTIIDATDQVVSPGFIDMHSHADWLLPSDAHPQVLKCMLEQGVTTVVGGNCGVSPAPMRPETLTRIEDYATLLIDKPFEYHWRSMEDFFDYMGKSRPILNLAELVGHASVRYAATDIERGLLVPAELEKCLAETRLSLDAGACGLSFGLGYDPGMYSPLNEIEAFCEVAAEASKPVTVHVAAYSRISPCYPLTYLKAHNLRAIREILEIAQKTRCTLQLSHFIFVGRRSWKSVDAAIKLVDDARNWGLDVMLDAYPFTVGNTTILAIFPYWFLAMLPGGFDKRLALARLRFELEAGFRLVGFGYKDFQVMDIAVIGWEDLNGMTIDQIARQWDMSSFKTLLKITQKSVGAALMLFHGYSGEPGYEKPLETVLSHPACLFETDVILKSTGHSNPAGTGTFPKILGTYVRDKGLLALEDTVNRMTAASAKRFGINDRGLLAAGKAADIVVFDPRKISDSAPQGTLSSQKPKGIEHVFINGVQAVNNGTYVDDVRAGRMLRV